jgi:hypothetical protein
MRVELKSTNVRSMVSQRYPFSLKIYGRNAEVSSESHLVRKLRQ